MGRTIFWTFFGIGVRAILQNSRVPPPGVICRTHINAFEMSPKPCQFSRPALCVDGPIYLAITKKKKYQNKKRIAAPVGKSLL